MCHVAHAPLRNRTLNAFDLMLARNGVKFLYPLHFPYEIINYEYQCDTQDMKFVKFKVNEKRVQSTETRCNYINCKIPNKLLAIMPLHYSYKTLYTLASVVHLEILEIAIILSLIHI